MGTVTKYAQRRVFKAKMKSYAQRTKVALPRKSERDKECQYIID